MHATIYGRGQMVIPAKARKEARIDTGDVVNVLPEGDGRLVLTARSENFLHGRPNLDDTIRRLQSFAEAGADVLYAPGLPSLEAIREVCASVSRPVNVVMGLKGATFSLEELAAAGVKRVSVGGALARAALAAWGPGFPPSRE